MQDESDSPPPGILSISPFLSPSLAQRDGNAYEFKFLIPLDHAGAVQAWARAHMYLDPHGAPEEDGAYTTTTLYCDTPGLDVLRKSSTYKRRKYRLRRYGVNSLIYLERKTRIGDKVRKKRTSIPDGDLAQLAGPVSMENWDGHWFHRRVLSKGLGPSCALSYDRTAFYKQTDDGDMRLTIDRKMACQRLRSWELPLTVTGLPINTGMAVLELKYRNALPSLFKQGIEEFSLQPTPHSKYRSAMLAWGVSSSTTESAHA